MNIITNIIIITRGVANFEKMSAALGEKQPKKNNPCGALESFFSLLRHP